MPKISTEKLQDRHNSILAAARHVLIENGFESLSIAQVARSADVSEGLIYRYFKNKHDLLCRVIAAFYSDFVSRIDAIVTAEAGFDQRLGRLIHTHLRAYVDEPEICRLFVMEVHASNGNLHPDLSALDKRYGSALMRFVRNGIREGEIRPEIDPSLARDMLWGVLDNVARRHLNGRMPIKVDVACRQIVDLLLGGLKNRAAASTRAKTTASHRGRVARAGNRVSA